MILDTFLIPDLMIPVSLLTVGSLGVHQLPIIPAYSKHFCPLPKVWGICVPFSDTVPNIFSAKWILNLKVSQILQYDSVYVSLEEIEIIASLFPYGFDTEQNFLCVIDTNIGVSNSSQRGSGDFLELSRKCDSSVIDELLQPDLRPILDLVLPFYAYLNNSSHTQQVWSTKSSACACGQTHWSQMKYIEFAEQANCTTWAVGAESFQWAVRAGQGNKTQTCIRVSVSYLT